MLLFAGFGLTTLVGPLMNNIAFADNLSIGSIVTLSRPPQLEAPVHAGCRTSCHGLVIASAFGLRAPFGRWLGQLRRGPSVATI